MKISMFLIGIACDVALFFILKRLYPKAMGKTWIRSAFYLQAFICCVLLLLCLIFAKPMEWYRISYIFSMCFTMMIPVVLGKMFFVIMYFAQVLFYRRQDKQSEEGAKKHGYLLTKLSPIFGVGLVGLFIYGSFFARYEYTIERKDVYIEKLPRAFEGYKVVYFTDLHAGNFAFTQEKLQDLIDKINAEEGDLVLFTGDLVNNFASEAQELVPLFQQITAREGKYAIRGNHDYGNYTKYADPMDSVVNVNTIASLVSQMGFMLLDNQNQRIEKEGAYIYIAGTENFSFLSRHVTRADLTKTLRNIDRDDAVILMTHNPDLWEDQIQGNDMSVDVTISGHVHGMQMGVNLFGYRLSPASFMFSYWDGLYADEYGQQLYVNRGTGVVGIIARFAMPPEITVLTLRQKH